MSGADDNNGEAIYFSDECLRYRCPRSAIISLTCSKIRAPNYDILNSESGIKSRVYTQILSTLIIVSYIP